MGVDWTATVAAWLLDQPQRRVPLSALRPLTGDAPISRRCAQRLARLGAGDPVLAALNELDTAGLIIFAHRWPPVVGVVDPDGLRAIAAAAVPPTPIGE